MRICSVALSLAVLAALSCRSLEDGRAVAAGAPREVTLGGKRPARLLVPDAAPSRMLPLLLLLHGYGGSAEDLLVHFGFGELARAEPVLLLVPSGTRDGYGHGFWNASEACCNFERRGVDDVAYLRGLIAEARKRFRVDPARIYAAGFSNGGFMAQRLACTAPELAAIVSIAGAFPLGTTCSPPAPPSVLQVHGDADQVVAYAGGKNILGRGGPAYPGAWATALRWAAQARCRGVKKIGSTMDLDESLPGAETSVDAAAACPKGLDVRLWTVRGAPHAPDLGLRFARAAWEWLKAHPRQAGR